MIAIPDPRDLLSLLPRVTNLLSEVEALVARIEQTRVTADVLIARIDATVDRVEEPIATLQPVLDRLAETTDPREVDALVTVIDQLPMLSEIVASLSTVAPDIHELLRVSTEFNEMMAKLPGMNRLLD